MSFCFNCGAQVSEHAKFCDSCGAAQNKTNPVTPIPPPNPQGTQGYQNAANRVEPSAPFSKSPQNRTGSKIPVFILSILLIIALVGGAFGAVSLNNQVSDLNKKNTTLTSNLDTANNKITDLTNSNTSLTASLAAANASVSDLTNKNATLTTSLAAANASVSDLTNKNATLTTSLAAANASVSDLTNKNATLTSSNTALTSSLTSANNTINTMNLNYQSILTAVNQRLGVGTTAETFITPNDSSVSSLVKSIVTPFQAGNWNKDAADIKTMYDWIYNHISNTSNPYPVLPTSLAATSTVTWSNAEFQFPSETIYSGSGNSIDQAILLASMIRNYENSQYAAYVIEIQNSQFFEGAVCLPYNGGDMVILDPFLGYYTGASGVISTTRTVAAELSNWLSFCSTYGLSNASVVRIYEDTYYKTFSSNTDFTNWMVANYP